MKIERINENQIRCTLSSFDLSVRNLNLGELAYGSEKARNLFREMIQKASNEVGFEAEDIPLMVEAIPLSNESVMLVITKIDDPEELDTRFSKFSPSAEDEAENLLNGLASELLEGADGLLSFLESKKPDSDKQTEDASKVQSEPAKTEASETNQLQAPQMRLYSFDSLDLIIEAAGIAGHSYQGRNTLYKKPDTHQYFLVLTSEGTENPLEFSRVCNTLAEYGSKVRHEFSSTEAYFKEHYEVIIKNEALQKLAQI